MVNASWHPNRATCAVSVGRSVYLVDGATGAVLHVARTPLATLALAYAPAKLGARLCALLRDGSLHAVDFEDQTRVAADARRASRGGVGGVPVRRLHPPTVNVKKRGLAAADRRGLICFGGDAETPWAVFALAGDVALRAARVLGGGDPGEAGDPGSPASASSAPSSPSVLSSRSGSSSSRGASSFGSALFGTKKAKLAPLLKIKGEHKKPLACVCGGGEANVVYAGYADGAVFCYDLKTQTCVGSASLPRAVVTRKKGGAYASTDDAADPLGIAAEKDRDVPGSRANAEELLSSGNGRLPGDGTVSTTAAATTTNDVSRVTKSEGKSRQKPVRSKAPPPCTAMAFVARDEHDAVLVVADVAGRLTSWSARPKPPEPAEPGSRVSGFGNRGSTGFGSSDARGLSGNAPPNDIGPPSAKPLKMKKRKTGPGGAPALELLSGARASRSNAPAFALGALPDGRGVAALAGERDRVTGAAQCLLKTFLVSAPEGTFEQLAGDEPNVSSFSGDARGNHPFPPLPPASHRAALASHPTQARVAAAAVADASSAALEGSTVERAHVRRSDAPPFTAFFASARTTGASRSITDWAPRDDEPEPGALRDRVEAEHVSTAATAAATPPPRRARVFFIGDDASVWSVAFAEGPRATRRCPLPPPPRGAEGAAPARLRVFSLQETQNAAAGDETSPRGAPKELFLTLWRRPGAARCAAACVVDGATGARVASVAARDAVFVAAADAASGGETPRFAALARDGASVAALECAAAAATNTVAAFELRALFSDDPKAVTVSAYRLFPGPERGSVVAACLVNDDASVLVSFSPFPDDAEKNLSSRRVVAPLERGERALDAAWQLVGLGDGAADATPWGGLAVLTTRRLILYEYALTSRARDDGDDDGRGALTLRASVANHRRGGVEKNAFAVASFLWVGPALLFAHADGVSVLGWDGRVSLACACGVGGGAELALSAATEDALLTFLDAAGDGSSARADSSVPRAVAYFRPVALADALAIGWGSLIAAKTRDRDARWRVADGVALVARRAVATAFARHDASRVSPLALEHVARSLALPGLAADVAARATHLRFDARARFLVGARRVRAALETTRASLNAGVDPDSGRDPASAARDVPHVPTDAAAAATLRDACEAAASAGDAADAFDAACLAFGASGGADASALERLLEYGVANAGLADQGDGGFPALDASVERGLAPGAAREACAAAARRRARRDARRASDGQGPRFRPLDRAGAARASAGTGVALGWSAVPASVMPETKGAPTRETSRVSALTHADALGRRVAGAAPFAGGVEGDAAKIEARSSNHRRDADGAIRGGVTTGTDRDRDVSPFGSGSRRPAPLVVPATAAEATPSASPGVLAPPPPPFRAFDDDGSDASDGGSETFDPFPWAPEDEEDAFTVGGTGDGDGDGAFGVGVSRRKRDGDTFESGGDVFAISPGDDAFGPGRATRAGDDTNWGTDWGHQSGHPGGASFGALALPGPSSDPFGSDPPAPGVGATREETRPGSDAAVVGFGFGFGFGDVGGGVRSPGFESNADHPHPRGASTTTHANDASAFGTPFSRSFAEQRGSFARTELEHGDVVGADARGTRPVGAAGRPGVVADPFVAPVAFDSDAFDRTGPSLAFSNAPVSVAIDDAPTDDDPFGAVSDEDPFGDAEEEEEEEEASRDAAPNARAGEAVGAVGAAAQLEAEPLNPKPPPRPLAPRVLNQTHPETLRWSLRGIEALERSDYETCESAFKAATKRAVSGAAPSVKAAAKCRSYAVAARALRFARAVSQTIETDASAGDDASKEDASVAKPKRFDLSRGRNLAAARELARLARHVAALPLDAKHRACACRFAAAWHFRLGAHALGGEYLAAAATATAVAAQFEGEEGARARAALAPLARCAHAVARGAKPGGPFREVVTKFPFAPDASEVAGWVCAATLRSLAASPDSRRANADASDDAARRAVTEGSFSAAAECARCRAAHCEAFARGENATCAVCDAPFRV